MVTTESPNFLVKLHCIVVAIAALSGLSQTCCCETSIRRTVACL